MGATGIAMLFATGLSMMLAGLPAWLVLLGNAMLFALGGICFGAFTLPLLFALPVRVLGLLEHDLLQALPLYVLIGAMLNRLPLADILFRAGARLLGRSTSAPKLAGLGLGALLAPMNGSVGASVAMLTRAVLPRLDARSVPAEEGAALICCASTIGVVVPPSLVLILLGDAMLRAHTEALNLTHASTRIINTQDIFHGALLPAALMLLLFFLVTWWRGRRAPRTDDPPILATRGECLVAGAAVTSILALLASVTLGVIYPVEAAATGGLALCMYGLLTRTLTWPLLKLILHDALAISGSLFALLVAATVYTLVLRAFETDLWIAGFLRGFGNADTALIVVLLILGLSGFILDAIEIIFVIVPVVMPPLLTLAPDATWVAVLALLVLQMSFLLPPFGYAVLMVGSVVQRKLSQAVLARALLPYLLVQACIVGLVLARPGLVWHSHPAARSAPGDQASDAQVQEMLDQLRRENDPAAAEAAAAAVKPD